MIRSQFGIGGAGSLALAAAEIRLPLPLAPELLPRPFAPLASDMSLFKWDFWAAFHRAIVIPGKSDVGDNHRDTAAGLATRRGPWELHKR